MFILFVPDLKTDWVKTLWLKTVWLKMLWAEDLAKDLTVQCTKWANSR
jgi:hypothetical protein